jgi:hypothetical protein
MIMPKIPAIVFEKAPIMFPIKPWNALLVEFYVKSIYIPFLKEVKNAQGEIDKCDKTLIAIFFIG